MSRRQLGRVAVAAVAAHAFPACAEAPTPTPVPSVSINSSAESRQIFTHLTPDYAPLFRPGSHYAEGSDVEYSGKVAELFGKLKHTLKEGVPMPEGYQMVIYGPAKRLARNQQVVGPNRNILVMGEDMRVNLDVDGNHRVARVIVGYLSVPPFTENPALVYHSRFTKKSTFITVDSEGVVSSDSNLRPEDVYRSLNSIFNEEGRVRRDTSKIHVGERKSLGTFNFQGNPK